jgi:hypothetical protein
MEELLRGVPRSEDRMMKRAVGKTASYMLALLKEGTFVAVLLICLVSCLWRPDIYLQMVGFYTRILPAFYFAALGVLVVRGVAAAPAAPLSGFFCEIRKLRPRHAGIIALIIPFLSAYTTLKINIPAVTPFYADPGLARFDRWLHGADPWTYARALPADVSLLIGFFYSKLWFGVALGSFIHATIVCRQAEFKRLAMVSLAVYIGLGVILATALSSVGPVFYDLFYAESRFADLGAVLAADPYSSQQKIFMDYLYTAAMTNTARIGTGISAFPSIHVGIAVTVAWYMTSRGPFSMVIGWCFAAIILFGSVYTGWHYAVDGYASLVAATAFWFVASRWCRVAIAPWAGRSATGNAASQQ